MSWRTAFDALYNNTDDVDIFQTTHHPYVHNDKPWGMEIEVGHNLQKDIWVKITPASGSKLELIDKSEADDLMKDGYKLISTMRNKQVTYTDSEGKVTTFQRQ